MMSKLSQHKNDTLAGRVSGRTVPGGPAGRVLGESAVFFALMAALFLLAPGNRHFLLTTALIYMLLATSISMLFGWSGISSFGHAAYFGIGAYTVGLLREKETNMLVAVVLAALVAGAAALLFGIIASRVVEAAQFAILTLVVAQMLHLMTFRVPVLNGDDGMFGIPRGDLFGLSFWTDDEFWWFALAVVTVVLALLRFVHRSAFGTSLAALRDDPVRAEALGLPTKALRICVLGASGAVAGVAGGLFAQQQGIVTPSTLGFLLSGQIIIMAMLGGMGKFWGPALGGLVFTIGQALLFEETGNALLYVGGALLLLILFLPDGLTRLSLRALRRG